MKNYKQVYTKFKSILDSKGSKDAQPMPLPYSDVIHSFFKHMRTISSHQHPAFPRDNGNLLFPEGRKKRKNSPAFYMHILKAS